MKQSELKRRTPLSRGKKRRLSEEERDQAGRFHASVQGQRCANCNVLSIKLLEAHHCVEAQELRRREAPVYDERNAMGLCWFCHIGHTSAMRRVSLAALTEDNWAFAREVLGEAADDYLKRRYRDA